MSLNDSMNNEKQKLIWFYHITQYSKTIPRVKIFIFNVSLNDCLGCINLIEDGSALDFGYSAVKITFGVYES